MGHAPPSYDSILSRRVPFVNAGRGEKRKLLRCVRKCSASYALISLPPGGRGTACGGGSLRDFEHPADSLVCVYSLSRLRRQLPRGGSLNKNTTRNGWCGRISPMANIFTPCRLRASSTRSAAQMRTPAPRTVRSVRSDSPHGSPRRKKDTSYEVSVVVTRGRIELPFQP